MSDGTAGPGADGLYRSLIFISLILTLGVVILSAYIRLSDAGLGCAEWPACYGRLDAAVPPPAGGALQARLPDTWAGVAHRLLASLLALSILAMNLITLRRHGHKAAGPLVLLVLTFLLATLGFVTPSPRVPAVTLGNLLGGMAMLGILWWLGRGATTPRGHATHALRNWARAGFVVLVAQIALGAWTSANFAASSCATLPDCHGDWWPGEGWREAFDPARRLGVDAEDRVVMDEPARAIHMTHRLGALITLLVVGWLGSRAISFGGGLRTTGVAILVLLFVQAGLGVLAVTLALPLLIVTAHNSVATLLLLSIVDLNYLSSPQTRA